MNQIQIIEHYRTVSDASVQSVEMAGSEGYRKPRPDRPGPARIDPPVECSRSKWYEAEAVSGQIQGKMAPEVSIIIPVYNEESIIEEALSDLERFKEEAALEIIVVDGHPCSSTILAIPNPGIKTLSAPKGRAVQMNRGAFSAQGDILLFLHADTRLPPGALKWILSARRSKSASGGSFDLGIRSDRRAFRLIEKMVYLRTRLTRIPYGDQAIFVERRFFVGMGGYREIPIMEDIDLMRRIRRDGHKIEIIPLPVSTSARRWEEEGIVSCTLRNWMLALLFLLGVPPERLKRHYEERNGG